MNLTAIVIAAASNFLLGGLWHSNGLFRAGYQALQFLLHGLVIPALAVGCPFGRIMLSDGLTSQQAAGEARDEVEVLDVAQLLLAAVTRDSTTR